MTNLARNLAASAARAGGAPAVRLGDAVLSFAATPATVPAGKDTAR